MDTLRTILESEEFTESRRALGIDPKRLDEILDGIVEVLCRDPEEFPQVEYTDLRRARTRPFPPEVASYGIFYSYDANTVTLKYIYRFSDLDE
jgi:hypothetical protein